MLIFSEPGLAPAQPRPPDLESGNYTDQERKMVDNLSNTLVKVAATNFLLQWGLFLLSVCLRTNKFWFMAGSSFVLLAAQSLINTGSFFPRQLIQTGLVYTWAFRLGLFLMLRTWKQGRDSRFDCVKNNHKLFFFYWTMQGAL